MGLLQRPPPKWPKLYRKGGGR